jgi:cell wall assembly regulator SMI1
VQKFTRPLTREIELAGERLALTFDETGISLRPVGSRRPPRQVSWAALICQIATGDGGTPAPEAVTEAVQSIKGGSPAKASPKKPESETAPAEASNHPIAAAWERLEKWLATHRKRYFEGLAPGASPAELQELEAAQGMPLPAPLLAWLSRHNGQSHDFVGSFVESWNLMNAKEIAEAKRDLDAMPAETAGGWQKAWIPFLSDDEGDYMVIDRSQPEGPVREYWQGQAEHPVVAPSPAAWLNDFVQRVERGELVEDPERGLFLHTRA